MVEPEVLESLVREHIEGVTFIEIRDLTGSKDHYEATIVAEAFAPLNRVKQHQLVYSALGDLMSGPVHALALKTFTPESWANRQES